jgi:hypothetical protein
MYSSLHFKTQTVDENRSSAREKNKQEKLSTGNNEYLHSCIHTIGERQKPITNLNVIGLNNTYTVSTFVS